MYACLTLRYIELLLVPIILGGMKIGPDTVPAEFHVKRPPESKYDFRLPLSPAIFEGTHLHLVLSLFDHLECLKDYFTLYISSEALER